MSNTKSIAAVGEGCSSTVQRYSNGRSATSTRKVQPPAIRDALDLRQVDFFEPRQHFIGSL